MITNSIHHNFILFLYFFENPGNDVPIQGLLDREVDHLKVKYDDLAANEITPYNWLVLEK